MERESVAAEARTEWRGRTATAAGALISLIVLTVVVVWSYRLGVRDAAEIPVIRAEIEATKIKPEEPGGMIVDHQDRVVYDVVSGNEGGQTATLATPPETLAAEDLAPSVAPDPAPRPIPAPDAEVVIAEPEPEATPPAAEAPQAEAPAAEAPPPAAAAEAPEPVQEAPATLAEDTETTEAPAEAEAEVAEPTLAPQRAPRATPRPARSRPAPAATANATTGTATTGTATTATDAPEPRAAALASAVQIQLGAFNSEAIAAEEWAKIKSRNGDLLAGRGRVITPVLSGGRRLFRLRAGPFDTVAQASALCRGLQARNEACIVARAR
ncbi:MAG: SPOR domain-containing protein [Pseudomonadota bacterium]